MESEKDMFRRLFGALSNRLQTDMERMGVWWPWADDDLKTSAGQHILRSYGYDRSSPNMTLSWTGIRRDQYGKIQPLIQQIDIRALHTAPGVEVLLWAVSHWNLAKHGSYRLLDVDQIVLHVAQWLTQIEPSRLRGDL